MRPRHENCRHGVVKWAVSFMESHGREGYKEFVSWKNQISWQGHRLWSAR